MHSPIFQVLDTNESKVLGTFCGLASPKPVTSSRNRMTILFAADINVAATGFNVTWERKCGGTYTDRQGIITSPNFPRSYPKNSLCVYNIKPNKGEYVTINFRNFTLEGGSGKRGCRHDYLMIEKVRTKN